MNPKMDGLPSEIRRTTGLFIPVVQKKFQNIWQVILMQSMGKAASILEIKTMWIWRPLNRLFSRHWMYEKQITNIYCYLFLLMTDYLVITGIHWRYFKKLYLLGIGDPDEIRCRWSLNVIHFKFEIKKSHHCTSICSC